MSRSPGKQALRKGRYSTPNGVYFVTIVTHKRIPWFQEFDLACSMSRRLADSAFFADARNFCWVVMPDHVHLLLSPGEFGLSGIVGRLKGISARDLNRQIGRKGRFWEASFHDHGLRKEEALRQVARYIVANPLRAGLAEKASDYPYWNAIWL